MIKGTLFRKLFVVFSIVIIVSLSTVSIVTYWTSSKELDVLAEHHMSQIVNNSVIHTDLYLKSYERLIISILTDRFVREFIDLPFDRKPYEYYHFRSTIKDAMIFPAFISSPNIAAIYLISFNENAIYYYNENSDAAFDSEEMREQLQFLRENTNDSGDISILNYSILKNHSHKMLTLARQIRGLTSPEMKGLIAIEFRSADLSELWQGIDLGKNGYLFIGDANGEIVHHPDPQKIGTQIPERLGVKIMNAGESLFEDVENKVERVYLNRQSEYSGWNLVVSMPKDELRKPIANIRITTIIVGMITLFIAMLIAFRFGKSITEPLQMLKKGMRETEKGNWALIPLPKQRDEIGELMSRYNIMVNRLSEMVQKVYQVELKNHEIQLERQKAEFQSLQLQINPHFLYNTLETIVCYNVVQESEDISEIVHALAYMLRYSVQTNLEEITVANELKHVMYFMNVLRHRVGRTFEIDVVVKPEFLLSKMVRLTLQPLVENVFHHGFRDGVEDYHYIRIDAGLTEDTFWVSVEDNGCGMTEDKLLELREKLNANRLADGTTGTSGVGVLNVHRRIQMVFGEQYGLRVESELDKGTTMIMVMPASLSNKS